MSVLISIFKKSLTVISFALLVCGVSLAQSVSNNNKQDPSYLFVLSAKSGEISKVKNHYILKLEGIDPNTLVFTDRPVRQAGYIVTRNFITQWQLEFKKDPPNAGLVYAGMDSAQNGGQAPIALELIDPSQNGNKVEFKISILSKDFAVINAQRLEQVHLFIDPPAPRLLDFHQMPLSMPAMT